MITQGVFRIQLGDVNRGPKGCPKGRVRPEGPRARVEFFGRGSSGAPAAKWFYHILSTQDALS